MKKTLRILGIRGLPAAHGGFETFAEYLSLYLVERGWRVIVYCQVDGSGDVWSDTWRGVERINIPVAKAGPLGTIIFDWRATQHAARFKDLCLTLGYNTAVFCAWLRFKGVKNVINMDGIEWRRAKWGVLAKTWFYLNEHAGAMLGNHLVADNPGIAAHLARHTRADKISTIAYGAEHIGSASAEPLASLGLSSGGYYTVIARPEPENSVLEIVKAFSAKPRNKKLAVLGKYIKGNEYHDRVLAAAGPEVLFLGAIYDKSVLTSLRKHCVAYIHGHQVGGTNPSLVEALGAGNPVLAFDNIFNRWVAESAADYFIDEQSLARIIDGFESDGGSPDKMSAAARARFFENFTWEAILGQYEAMLVRVGYLGDKSFAAPEVGGAQLLK